MRIDQDPLKLWIVLLIVMLFFTINCDDPNELQDFEEGVGFRFGIWDDTTGCEDFIAVTTGDETIALAREQLLLPVSERTLHIHGLAARGNGGHNLNWRWHFLASEWVLVEASIEYCDTRPSKVSAWLDVMPDTLTSILICPLSSYVKSETESISSWLLSTRFRRPNE